MKMKKLAASVCASVLALSCCAAVAFAETQSQKLNYKGVTADAKLVCNFGIKPFASDDAKATTTFTTAATNGYQVAVRLECWQTDAGVTGYKYARDWASAELNYNWSDVYCYMSRHSIDDASGSEEVDVCVITDREGLSG